MSYINKPGKTTAWRSMVTRQQVSDVISYSQIVTTLTKAKITQKYVERLITLAKVDNVANRRAAARILLTTKDFDRDDLVVHLFTKVAPKFINRNGGYTRVVKTGPRRGDSTEAAILQFVVTIPKTKKADKKVEKKADKKVEKTEKVKKTSAKATKEKSTKEEVKTATASHTSHTTHHAAHTAHASHASASHTPHGTASHTTHAEHTVHHKKAEAKTKE